MYWSTLWLSNLTVAAAAKPSHVSRAGMASNRLLHRASCAARWTEPPLALRGEHECSHVSVLAALCRAGYFYSLVLRSHSPTIDGKQHGCKGQNMNILRLD